MRRVAEHQRATLLRKRAHEPISSRTKPIPSRSHFSSTPVQTHVDDVTQIHVNDMLFRVHVSVLVEPSPRCIKTRCPHAQHRLLSDSPDRGDEIPRPPARWSPARRQWCPRLAHTRLVPKPSYPLYVTFYCGVGQQNYESLGWVACLWFLTLLEQCISRFF